MGITFNADEIFEMAEEIERNGARFYRKAAEHACDEATKQWLLDMAVMEDGHVTVFAEMRKQLGAPEKAQMVFDPDNEAVLYLQAMADSRGTEGKKSATKELTGTETIREIIEAALNAEKNSVVFYFSLKTFVSEKAGKDKVEGIILEEIKHITALLNKLKTLDG